MREKSVIIAFDILGMSYIDDYWIKVCQGVFKYARQHTHWQLLINDANLALAHKFSSFDELLDHGVQGIIFPARDQIIVERIKSIGIKAVNIMGNRGDQSIPSVRSDDLEIGTLAVRHFIARGFQHLAYCGINNWIWSALRARSFGETARLMGCDCSIFMANAPEGTNHAAIITSQPAQDWTTAQRLRQWISALPKPVGIMGCYDQTAIHVLEACQDLDLSVPDEVSVIGVDNNLILCESHMIPLSSIDLNAVQIGYEAADMMNKLVSGIPLVEKHMIFPPGDVVSRLSTDKMAVKDPAVAAALAYIGKHFAEAISMADVARATGICKAHLERRFRNHLHCTIGAEVRRHRLYRAQTLLADPTLSLDQIAQSSGLRRATYLVNFFHKHTGMTPNAWRKKHGYGIGQ